MRPKVNDPAYPVSLGRKGSTHLMSPQDSPEILNLGPDYPFSALGGHVVFQAEDSRVDSQQAGCGARGRMTSQAIDMA